MSQFIKSNQQLWQGRGDSLPNERLFQHVECIDLQSQRLQSKGKPAYAFIGFCSDEGIKRNLGRIGAKEGPLAIRKALINLPTHEFKPAHFYDVGDVCCDDGDLESAQQSLALMIKQLLLQNITPIVLGGGHETAWGHYQGIAQANPDLNLGIINFDAHFDLRPLIADNKGTSGTSFLQIAKACQQGNKDFNYFCIGIQQSANTKSLFDTADNLNVETIAAKDIHQQNLQLEKLQDFINKVDKIYLTFCLDVMAQAYAPGVSAPQAHGLMPAQAISYLKAIVASKKVVSFDIVELSPKWDQNNMTAQLAAMLVYEFLATA